jgi:hypothetical protein
MEIPISLQDFRAWITYVAILLVVTNELLGPHLGRLNIVIDRKRMRTVTYYSLIAFFFAFMVSFYIELFL